MTDLPTIETLDDHKLGREMLNGLPGYGCSCGTWFGAHYGRARDAWREHVAPLLTEPPKVIYTDPLEEWRDSFRKSLEMLANTRQPFTSEDILEVVGLPKGKVAQHGNNAVGALMGAAAKRGLIKRTGVYIRARRPSSHGAELKQWVGVG